MVFIISSILAKHQTPKGYRFLKDRGRVESLPILLFIILPRVGTGVGTGAGSGVPVVVAPALVRIAAEERWDTMHQNQCEASTV